VTHLGSDEEQGGDDAVEEQDSIQYVSVIEASAGHTEDQEPLKHRQGTQTSTESVIQTQDECRGRRE
jgi:hypothetical protein